MGIDLTSLHQSELQADGRVSQNKFGGGLDYVTLQVPLTIFTILCFSRILVRFDTIVTVSPIP